MRFSFLPLFFCLLLGARHLYLESREFISYLLSGVCLRQPVSEAFPPDTQATRMTSNESVQHKEGADSSQWPPLTRRKGWNVTIHIYLDRQRAASRGERETGRGGERTRKTASLLFRDLFNLIKISFRLFIIFEWGESWSAWKYFTFLSLLLAWSRVDSLSLGAFHEKYLFVTFLWVPRFAGRWNITLNFRAIFWSAKQLSRDINFFGHRTPLGIEHFMLSLASTSSSQSWKHCCMLLGVW